jgi:hypothetical protein
MDSFFSESHESALATVGPIGHLLMPIDFYGYHARRVGFDTRKYARGSAILH